MKKFEKQALDLVKQAVFQDKPLIIISADADDLYAAYRGNENQLVDYLQKAIANDRDLKRIVKRALSADAERNLEETILKLKTA